MSSNYFEILNLARVVRGVKINSKSLLEKWFNMQRIYVNEHLKPSDSLNTEINKKMTDENHACT